MDKVKIVVIGAGPSGLAAAYSLKSSNCFKDRINLKVLETRPTFGGLCDQALVKDGFSFDRFVHFVLPIAKKTLAFDSKSIFDEFNSSSTLKSRPAKPLCWAEKSWVPHPIITNLYALKNNDKLKNNIIKDAKKVNSVEKTNCADYAEWLLQTYGKSYSDRFVVPYTQSYWGIDPKEMGISWISNRMYSPDIKEIEDGAHAPLEISQYYVNEMFYPEREGFRSILKKFEKTVEDNISYNSEVVSIDVDNKQIVIKNTITKAITFESYDYIISSMPLPRYVQVLSNGTYDNNLMTSIWDETCYLRWTQGIHISIALNKKIDCPLWFYNSEKNSKDTFARVYSVDGKSSANVPEGKSAIQVEVYKKNADTINIEKCGKAALDEIKSILKLSDDDIEFVEVGYEPFANIIFEPNNKTENLSQHIRDRLEKYNIFTCGRFGEWKYFWTHDAFNSGIKHAEKVLKIINNLQP